MRLASTRVISLVAAAGPGGEFQAANFPSTMTVRGVRTRSGVVDLRGT